MFAEFLVNGVNSCSFCSAVFLFDELLVEGLCPESKFSIGGNTGAGVGVGTDSGPAIGPVFDTGTDPGNDPGAGAGAGAATGADSLRVLIFPSDEPLVGGS